MGTKTFDFLTESFLFDDSLIRDRFQRVPDEEIQKELRRYREFCLSNAKQIEKEIISNDSNLKVFPGTELIPPMLLKQSAFYVEQYIQYDPIFSLTHERNETAKAMNEYMGFSNQPFNRSKLTQVVRYLKSLTPMVAANYVKFIPATYVFEPPEQIPLTYSEKQYADILPQTILKFFHNNVIVESMKRVDQGLITEGKLYPCRAINIRFNNHYGPEPGFSYFLFGMEYLSNEEKDQEIHVDVKLQLPDTVPDLQTFDNWVLQSINQSSKRLFDRILLESVITSHFEARYLSISPFVFELLGQTISVEQDIKTNTCNVMMNMELPFLHEVDMETLMKVRLEDGEAFQSFRLEMDRQLRELRLVNDPDELKIKAENALHEVTEVQLHQVSDKVKELKKRSKFEGAVLLAGLASAIQTGGWSLLACAGAIASGYKSRLEYQSEVKQNPAFFLWKVLDQSRKKATE